jgi:ATP-binding cassette subfamily F protein 3
VAPFSGGEKTRLALAIVVWQRPNLLIMDEPTNHLDMGMRHALTLALQNYEGAMMLVTHDRHLLRNTVDSLLLVSAGKVAEYGEDVNAYEQWVLSRQGEPLQDAEPARGKAQSSPRGKEARQRAAEHRAKLRPLKQRIEQTEKTMAELDSRLGDLEGRLTDTELYDAARKQELDTLLREEGELRRKASELEDTWLEQQEQLEALESGLREETA